MKTPPLIPFWLLAATAIAILAAIICTAGCASIVESHRSYETPPQTDRACFQVHWLSASEITRMSKGTARAFTSVMPDQFGYWHIYAQFPVSFGDEGNLSALGEELVHTLGGEHE